MLCDESFVEGINVNLELPLKHTICGLLFVLEQRLLRTSMLLLYTVLQVVQLGLHVLYRAFALAFPWHSSTVKL